MSNLSVRKLHKNEVIDIYHEHLVYDFPSGEQKPLKNIINLYEEGKYICYGLFEIKKLRGYAFFSSTTGTNNLLLDYFCVLNTHRGGGYGGKFLRLMKNEAHLDFDGFILEVEDDKFAQDEEDLKMRQRRISFYYANGVKGTKVRSSTKNVKYLIMYFPFLKEWEDEVIMKDLDLLYQTLYSAEGYERILDYIRIENAM